MKNLILGGTRSGKSQYAEQLAIAGGKQLVYIATAYIGDNEMLERIGLHRSRRSAAWQLVEEPIDLAGALAQHSSATHCVLVDCVTLWLSNVLHESGNADIQTRIDALCHAVRSAEGEVILVSAEVGLGVIPANALARRYADLLGLLNQQLAERCDEVTLVVAGLPHKLKTQED